MSSTPASNKLARCRSYSCGGNAIQQQVNRHWASTSYKQLNRSSFVPNLSISGKSYGRDQTNIDASQGNTIGVAVQIL